MINIPIIGKECGKAYIIKFNLLNYKMVSIEDKLEVVERRFRKGSKSYQAARYIVRKNREIPEDEKAAIVGEVPLASKTLEGVFTKLKKLGLYGDTVEDIHIGAPPTSFEPPQEIPQLQPQESRHTYQGLPLQSQELKYVTVEDFNDFKSGFNESLNKALNKFMDSVVNDGAEPEEFTGEQNFEILQPDEMAIRDPSLTRKSVWLKPKTQMYFDLARQGIFVTYADSNEMGPFREFAGNISDFFNIVVDDYFIRNYNADIGILMRRYIR